MRKGKGFNRELRIGLSRTGVALLQSSGWLRRRTDLVADAALSEDDFTSTECLATRLSALIAEAKCSSLPATVILANDLVRLFMVTPPNNAMRLQDCRSAAEMRFRSLYGDTVADWQLQADWNNDEPFLACAIPNLLLTALTQLAKERDLTCIEIVPQFIAVWNRWRDGLNGNAWFGVANGNLLTLGAITAQRLSAVRTTAVPVDGWSEQNWLPDYLGRESLRLNLPMPQQLRICGDVPGHWTSQNFGSLACVRLDAAQRSLGNASASSTVMLAHSGAHQ
jgi:hypothetical protein